MSGAAARGSAIDVALAIWGRRKRLATTMLGILLTATVTLALSLPGIYRSTATLLVEQPGAAEGSGKWSVASELETRLHTIQEEVLSRARLEALMDRFDLYPELRTQTSRDAAVERLWGDIQVKLKAAEPGTARPTTIAFSVSFRGRNPETVARVANALASFYMEENQKLRERSGLARLRQELIQMQDFYSNQYPDILRLKAEIASIERHLVAGQGVGPAPSAAPDVGTPSGGAGRELGDATPRRDQDARVAEARMARDREQRERASAEFRILDPAIPGRGTVAPNRIRLLLFAVAFAVGATAAAVLLVEHLDTSFHALEELREFTKVPVLASVPHIVTAVDARPQPLWRTAGPIAVGLALVVLVSYYFARGNEQLVWILSRGAS